MHNEFPISITINSPGGQQADARASGDAPPSPLGLDVLGSPAATSTGGAAGAPGAAPAPLPLGQLGAAATGADAEAPPSPSDSVPAAGGTDAPEPLPVEELQEKVSDAAKGSTTTARTRRR